MKSNNILLNTFGNKSNSLYKLLFVNYKMAIRERKPNKRNASINEINTYNYVNTEPNQHMVYRLKNKKRYIALSLVI